MVACDYAREIKNAEDSYPGKSCSVKSERGTSMRVIGEFPA